MDTILSNLSDTLADAVATGGRSTVRVEARRRFHASGILWSEDGTIVTNHHVVQRSENIRVGLPNGESIPATLVGRDPTTDIALLSINATGLDAASQAEIDDVRVGNLALALGRPGTNIRATLGIISARSESWRTPAGGTLDQFVQSDISLFPGFSGGPLVNADGATLGMTSSGLLRGISMIVPNVTLRRIVDAIVLHGRIPRGYLGVSTYAVILPPKIAERLGQEEGLLLVTVEPESPAERSGLIVGDIIVSLAGRSVEDLESLQAGLGGESIGTAVPARIVRGGAVEEIEVEVGERR
jgi:S1-C subfamily serine protease